MKNLKVRVKMMVCFGIILLLIVILNGGSLVNLRQISNLVPEIYNGPYQNSIASLAASRELYRMDGFVKSMVVNGTLSGYQDEYEKAHTSLEVDLAAILAGNAQAKTEVATIQTALAKMSETQKSIASAVATKQEAKALSGLSNFAAALAEAVKASDALAFSANNKVQSYVESAEKRADNVVLVQDVLFVLILLACVSAAIKLSSDVTNPVHKLAKGMQEIAQGNLSACIENNSKDELGILAEQINTTMGNLRSYINDISRVLGEMGQGDFSIAVTQDYIGDFGEIKKSLNCIIDSLNQTLAQIKICCSQVRGGSESLAVSAENLAQGAVEQATALDEFQASMHKAEEIAVRNGENAAQIQGISARASDTVVESDGQMQQMTASMTQINASSKEIAKVIKIIEDIAFQTNILALNAAVEAARAGAAGKGFAVVADEVRNLASKSAQAAKNTTSMINKAVNAVDDGMKNAELLSTTMQQVKDCVNSMEQLLEEIGKSAAEQNAAFGSMAEAVDQISSVVHRNSAAAEENSAASEQLSSQAEILDGLVTRFQLKNRA